MKIIKQSQKALIEAAAFLENGGVVICPTDTVYGFLALASNRKAVENIFKIKKRPRSKPLAVFVFNIKQAKEIAEINKDQEKILKKFWPGKFTFILKIKKNIDFRCLSKLIVGKGDTIGIRIPKYKFLNDLLKKINKPLAQTSVNISGQPALTKIADIIEKFGGSDPPMLIIDGGNLPESNPSKIIDLTSPHLTRIR